MSVPSKDSPYSKDRPFPALVTENRLLSRPGSAKETRHLVVDLAGSELAYKSGDSLGVFPTNLPAAVDDVLRLLGASGDESVEVQREPNAISLREALSSRLSLASPTRKALASFGEKVTDAAEKEKIGGLLAPESREALSAYLADREFADLLEEYPSAKFAPQEFVAILRRLMPRLYSIASSPKRYPNEAHLTVAVVRYRTNNKDRIGVCSTFLADRVETGKTPTPVFVARSHFAPPEDASRDCIMVGPGTGIAPFRAFVQERSSPAGRNWVFFGDQHRATDFLYEEEWTQYLESGQLARLDLAWSRDQAHKIYVQDRMRENAAELWAWLEKGACFYVCGEAKRMARDVDAALHDIIAQQGGMPPEKAVEYVKQLKKDRRYQRDIY